MRKEDFLQFVPEKYKAGNLSENIAAKATIKAVLDSIGLDFTIRTKGDQITITAINPTPADSDILEKIDSAFCDYCFDYSGDFYDPKKPEDLIEGLPCVKWVFVNNCFTEDFEGKAREYIKNRFAEDTDEKTIQEMTWRVLNRPEYFFDNAADFWNPIIKEKAKKTAAPAPMVSSEKVAENCEFIETDRFFQVKFAKKPASEVLETLKRNGFKWFRAFGYWGTFKNGRTADQMRAAIGL